MSGLAAVTLFILRDAARRKLLLATALGITFLLLTLALSLRLDVLERTVFADDQSRAN